MTEILDNALDSVRMGLRHYQDQTLKTRDKWAILEFFHAIELLLKERLSREHPLLIYRRLDKTIHEDSQTVGVDETLKRFTNLDVSIPEEYVEMLSHLKCRRNRIEHHRFIPDKKDRKVLGESLKFIDYFLREHLADDLEDHVPEDLFREVRELIRGYDEVVRRAKERLAAARSQYSPKEQAQLGTGTCEECGNKTVLVGEGDETICHFCEEPVDVAMCSICGEYLPPSEIVVGEMCGDCLSYKLDRD